MDETVSDNFKIKYSDQCRKCENVHLANMPYHLQSNRKLYPQMYQESELHTNSYAAMSSDPLGEI